MWLSRRELLELKTELHRALAEAEETRKAMARLEKTVEHIARHFQWPGGDGSAMPPSPGDDTTKR